jgi:hypothetical protein
MIRFTQLLIQYRMQCSLWTFGPSKLFSCRGHSMEGIACIHYQACLLALILSFF